MKLDNYYTLQNKLETLSSDKDYWASIGKDVFVAGMLDAKAARGCSKKFGQTYFPRNGREITELMQEIYTEGYYYYLQQATKIVVKVVNKLNISPRYIFGDIEI